MILESGQQLLHYRLVEKVGEGGMGVVWKARDPTLERDVAIKVLPEELAADPERLARFEREAKLLAQLRHPNITTVHGLHETAGRHFLVMEFVDGENLEQRLQRGALPQDEVLVVARQVADALEAAHEQGIVHRDLKPANIVIVGDDLVEVLDFGLAKALSPEPPSGSGTTPATSPTVTSMNTRDGMILGTAAYMSPEQARGKQVDRRADIWAFGCLLFELLTAKAVFAGETVSDTLVAILSREPDWSLLPASTSPRVRLLIERCLERDARRRLRDIGEARILLEDVIAGDAGTETVTETAAPVAKGLSPARLALLAVVGAALFAAGWIFRPVSESTGSFFSDHNIRRLTFEEGLEFEPAMSPDGHYIVYTTNRAGNLDIEIMSVEGGEVSPVVTHPADDAQPRWSPDGTRLAFVSARDRETGLLINVGDLGGLSTFVTGEGGDIFLVPARGGAATKLIDNAAYPSWSPDGS